MNTPFQGFPPELLAKIAQGAFRPPQGVGGMQAPGMQMPQGGGFGMPGMGGMGLGGFRPTGGGLNPNGMPEDASLGGAVAGINALQPGANGQFAQPPMPTDIGSGQGGGSGSFGSWLKGLF